MNEVSRHFDKMANDYDRWKKKSWYYYQNLKRLVREHIPPGKKVLEIGCGTGDILANLTPKIGIGIDISEKMIELAKDKYKDCPDIYFYNLSFQKLNNDIQFDFIILVDVVEHVENMQEMAKEIRNKTNQQTKIFISMANPFWEPILLLLEKLKLKMPEGKHYRLPTKKLIEMFHSAGFKLKKYNFDLLVPFFIPWVSDFLNRWSKKIPLLKRFGLIEYLIFDLGEQKQF